MFSHSPGRLGGLLLFWAGAAGWAQPPKEDAQAKLAVQARDFLEKSCARCHDGEGSSSGEKFNVRDHATLVAKLGDDAAVIVPGKADQSKLWTVVAKGRMPEKGSEEREAFAKEQGDVLRRWIDAGAPAFPKDAPRKFVGLKTVLQAVKDDLDAADLAVRPNLRYFTLTHLHNNNAKPGSHLHSARAALAKAVNSLTWGDQIVPIRAVDPAKTAFTVYAVDIAKLGWKRGQWEAILNHYPYGLGYDSHDDADLKKLDRDITRLGGNQSRLPYVRADWFVSTATRGPLYNALLYDEFLPDLVRRAADPKNPLNPKGMTARDLELYLKIDVAKNILGAVVNAQRAGFAKSGVSGNNRLIERHPIDGRRYYWKSYDFKQSTWEANLQQFPLGPTFKQKELYGDVAEKYPDTHFPEKAFVHDGGEIVFSLPNGLQGYLLIDGADRRIDAGPIEVVSDALKTSGTALVVCGVSCMGCHKDGVIKSPPDLVRDGAAAFGAQRDRVKLLYPAAADMAKLTQRDADFFRAALTEATLPVLTAAGSPADNVKELSEPVGEVAREYLLKDLDLAAAAAELYIENPAQLKAKIDGNADLLRIGVGALLKDKGVIKRGAWESVRGTSQMQQLAREFGFSPNN